MGKAYDAENTTLYAPWTYLERKYLSNDTISVWHHITTERRENKSPHQSFDLLSADARWKQRPSNRQILIGLEAGDIRASPSVPLPRPCISSTRKINAAIKFRRPAQPNTRGRTKLTVDLYTQTRAAAYLLPLNEVGCRCSLLSVQVMNAIYQCTRPRLDKCYPTARLLPCGLSSPL